MIIVFILIILGGFAALASENEICVPSRASFVLGPPEGVDPLKPLVPFGHIDHFDYSCNRCHHQWDGLSEIQTCTTSGCHDQTERLGPDELKEADAGRLAYFRSAYHRLCIACHYATRKEIRATQKELSKEELEKALAALPVRCTECHTGK